MADASKKLALFGCLFVTAATLIVGASISIYLYRADAEYLPKIPNEAVILSRELKFASGIIKFRLPNTRASAEWLKYIAHLNKLEHSNLYTYENLSSQEKEGEVRKIYYDPDSNSYVAETYDIRP